MFTERGPHRLLVLCMIIGFSIFFSVVSAATEGQEFKPLAAGGSAIFKPLESSEFEPPNAVSTAFEDDSRHDAKAHGSYDKLMYPALALILALVAGILVRIKKARFVRPLFLLSSLIIFGFINGGCPCVISSFQNFLLLGLGVDVPLYGIVWFTGAVLLTMLFGRVWCGWVCHLGALQEFLYRNNRFSTLKGESVQKWLKWSRNLFLFALVAQLVITRTNLFREYDPFKVAFNLTSYNVSGWVLLALLLVTSVFIYRPFCRGICPVGLVLGWVARLPGALGLAANSSCNQCGSCARSCDNLAIDSFGRVNAPDCIMCGNCLDTCHRKGYSFVRRPLPAVNTGERLELKDER